MRPLLSITRLETAEYCRKEGLRPRLDVTNLSLTPLRNRIRLELLPLLRQYNAGVEDALVRLASSAGESVEYLDGAAATVWSELVQEEGGAVSLDKGALLAQPRALQAHLLRRVLESLLGNIKDIERRHIENIMSTLELPAGRRIDLPYGLVFIVDYDRFWVGRPEKMTAPVIEGYYPLKVPGTTLVPGGQIVASYVAAFSTHAGKSVAYFDAGKTGSELAVRSWRRNDRFMPQGMQAEKKLGEFFIDEKIPRRRRKGIPLVVSNNRIIWVVGCRQDERFKITGEVGKILRLEFQNTGLYQFGPGSEMHSSLDISK